MYFWEKRMFEGNLLIKIGPEKRKNARSWSQKKKEQLEARTKKVKLLEI
jgi:hypothetical protein